MAAKTWWRCPAHPVNSRKIQMLHKGRNDLLRWIFLQPTYKFQGSAATDTPSNKGSENWIYTHTHTLNSASLSLNSSTHSLTAGFSSLSLPACLHCTGHYITDIRWFKQYLFFLLLSSPSLFTPLITVSTGALLSLGRSADWESVSKCVCTVAHMLKRQPLRYW